MTAADVERIKTAIGYDPVAVSVAGHPGIRETYRTVNDRDDLVRRLLPVLAEARTQARKQVAEEIAAVRDRQSFDPCYHDGMTRAIGIARGWWHG